MRVLAGFYDCALLFCSIAVCTIVEKGMGINYLLTIPFALTCEDFESLAFNSKVPFAVEESLSVCFRILQD